MRVKNKLNIFKIVIYKITAVEEPHVFRMGSGPIPTFSKVGYGPYYRKI